MLIKGEVKKEDITAFITHFVSTSEAIRKRILIMIVLYIVLTFIAYLVIISQITLLNFLICFLLVALIVLFLPSLFRKRIRTILSSKIEKTGLVQKLGAYTMELSDKGIELERAGSNKKLIEWENVQRIYADQDHYFLYYGNQHAIILPIRDMDTEKAEFLDWVNAQVKQENSMMSTTNEQNKKSKLMLVSIIAVAFIALLGYQGYQAYKVQPQYDFVDATNKVVALFEEETVEDEAGKATKMLKPSTTQEDIDEAMQAIAKIDTTKKRYEIYTLPLLALVIELNEAQKQLDERENGTRGQVPRPNGNLV